MFSVIFAMELAALETGAILAGASRQFSSMDCSGGFTDCSSSIGGRFAVAIGIYFLFLLSVYEVRPIFFKKK